MTNFKKIQKSHSKIYKERSQPEYRSHLGILTKKKDFKEVSKFKHKLKKKQIEKEKLIETRNPDEFYYRMLSKNKRPEDAYNEDQLKEFMTKDIKYLDTKLTLEKRKVEKLKSKLTIPSKPGRLIYFTDEPVNEKDSYEEVKFSELQMESLELQGYTKEQMEFYTELVERMERVKALEAQLGALNVKMLILNNKHRKYKIIREGTKTQAPIIRFR